MYITILQYYVYLSSEYVLFSKFYDLLLTQFTTSVGLEDLVPECPEICSEKYYAWKL